MTVGRKSPSRPLPAWGRLLAAAILGLAAQDTRAQDQPDTRFRLAPQPPPEMVTGTLSPPSTSTPVAQSSADIPRQPTAATRQNSGGSNDLILRLDVDGLDEGEHRISVLPDGSVRVDREVARVLRLGATARDGSAMLPPSNVTIDRSASTGVLRLPAGARLPLELSAPMGNSILRNSPETWGAWVDYDVNLRTDITQGSSRPRVGGGGLVNFRGAAPDFRVGSSWGFTDLQPGVVARFDTAVSWLPSNRRLAVTMGDGVAVLDAGGRAFRMGGIHVGSDLTSEPGFSSAPVVRVGGTAQALSVLEVLIGGQSVENRRIADGTPFRVLVPAGTGASIVLTDAAGRRVEVPIGASRIQAGLLREGLFLWAAGAGVPRFGYGGPNDRYSGGVHAYASARYGLLPWLTVSGSAEGGASGVAVLGGGFSAVPIPEIGIRGWASGSQSPRGTGARVGGALLLRGPWGLGMDLSYETLLGRFDDVVSVTARDYARVSGLTTPFAEAAKSRAGIRLSWAAHERLSLTAAYDVLEAREGRRSLASVTASTSVWGLPFYVTAARGTGNGLGTTVMVGTSFSLGGGTNAYVAGGIGSQSAGAGRFLGEGVGDIGWRAQATHANRNIFASAGTELRTGVGILGVEANGNRSTFGTTGSGYLRARGSAGLADGIPFVSDPVPYDGGIVVARTGRSGVPLERNGLAVGSSRLGGGVIPVTVAGVPTRVGITPEGLSADTLADTLETTVTVRRGGVGRTDFRVRGSGAAVTILVTRDGRVPPTGSVLLTEAGEVPVGPTGRAFVETLSPGATVTMAGPDGSTCRIATNFDGRGGPGRRIGPLPCVQ